MNLSTPRKRLLLLGAGREQIAAIQAAQSVGLSVIAVDGNPEAPGLLAADRGLCGDIRNVNFLFELGKQEKIAGVFSHAVDLPHVVAEVARRLQLPGLNPDVAVRATNKWRRYQYLSAQGVPCPKFQLVHSVQDAQEVAEEWGYPLVVKPVDSAGARGVCKVSECRELDQAFQYAMKFSQEPSLLVEEFLEGPEISTESVIIDGRIITTGFADRNYALKDRFAPYFIEDGHTIPSSLPPAVQRQIIQTVEKAIQVLGIDWGVAKGDVILTPRGPVIFEMAPRTSGGRFCADMVPLATGVHILPILMSMAVGKDVAWEDLTPKFQKGAAQRFLFPAPGEIVDVKGLEEARVCPGVYDIALREDVRRGGVVPFPRNHSDRVGHVIASGETREEAIWHAEQAIQMIQIETRSLASMSA